jgi:hypothetical protein
MKILFVGKPRDVSHALRTGQGLGGKAAFARAPGFPNITLFHPLKLLPNSLTAGRLANETLERMQVRRAARRAGLCRPVLWLNPHYAVHMAGRMGERGVIYDITDDWSSMGQLQRERRLIVRQDAELCRKADAVIVCSARLYEMKQGLARRLHLIPNGVGRIALRPCSERGGPAAGGVPGVGASGVRVCRLHPPGPGGRATRGGRGAYDGGGGASRWWGR